MNQYYVYIITNQRNTVLYIGVTNDLQRRVWEHKNKIIKGFTNKYNCDKLVYFENTNDIESALNREKQLKNWQRQWKIDLTEGTNKEWLDLGNNLFPRDPESSSG
jgi:putative endonuclease